MSFSRQDDSLASGRANQRARTRRALIDAAHELMLEGRTPSMPEAAQRALVSLATAYRYFRTAEDLWADAAAFGTSNVLDHGEMERSIRAAGDDVEARVATMIRSLNGALTDNQHYARQSAKASLDRWFAQQGTADEARTTRPRERLRWIALALEPLRERLEDYQVDAIAEAVGLVTGAEAVISALDVLGLSPEAAKERMVTTALWVLRSGLAECDAQTPVAKKPERRRTVT